MWLKIGLSDKKHNCLLECCLLTTTRMSNIKLHTPTLARKCDISRWFPCGEDERAGGRAGRDYRNLSDG